MSLGKLMNKSFLTRTISGFFLCVIIAVTAILGGDILFGAVYVISLIGLFELYRVAGMEKTALAAVGYIGTVVYYFLIRFTTANHFTEFAVGLMILVMAVYVFTFPKYSIDKVLMTYFGVMYVPVMMSYMYFVRSYNYDGIYTFWLIFVSSWACDTCAYLAGVIFGKHKMTPVLSPKKTIEGAVGGVIGAAAIGAVYGICIGGKLISIDSDIAPVLFAVIGAIGGLISMIGDLCASAIKRNYEKKDYGKLIPGHGGIMDRFDSVIITAPLIYYLIVYFAK